MRAGHAHGILGFQAGAVALPDPRSPKIMRGRQHFTHAVA